MGCCLTKPSVDDTPASRLGRDRTKVEEEDRQRHEDSEEARPRLDGPFSTTELADAAACTVDNDSVNRPHLTSLHDGDHISSRGFSSNTIIVHTRNPLESKPTEWRDLPRVNSMDRRHADDDGAEDEEVVIPAANDRMDDAFDSVMPLPPSQGASTPVPPLPDNDPQLCSAATSSLMPSVQSSEADRLRPSSFSVPSDGPSREPSPPTHFMTLVDGDGPTSQQMWSQLGADVMMEHSRAMHRERDLETSGLQSVLSDAYAAGEQATTGFVSSDRPPAAQSQSPPRLATPKSVPSLNAFTGHPPA